MKLLDWMNHKLRKSSIEPFKDLKIGSCCTCIPGQPLLEGPKCFPTNKLSKQSHGECLETFCERTTNMANEGLQEESAFITPEFFHGFLAIGTLGSEPAISEPGTPKFGSSSDNTTEKETEVSETELKLISNELEKFLEAEADEQAQESSGRNSFVVLSSKQIEGQSEEHEKEKLSTFPLQHYLLGTTMESADSKERTKERGSLEELFKKTEITDNYSKTAAAGKTTPGKEKKHLMRKILKKFQTSTKNSNTSASEEAIDSIAKRNKLKKVLQIFHKKVHPESPTSAEEFNLSCKHQIGKRHIWLQSEEKGQFPRASKTRDVIQDKMSSSRLTQRRFIGSSSIGNKEHWITTDTEYLVLEL